MSTLAANSSTTVTLQPGYALYIIGNATATFGAGPDSARAAFPFTGQAVLGPYAAATQAITITTGATGVNYQTMYNGEIEPPLRVSRDPSTGNIRGVETDVGDTYVGGTAIAATLGVTGGANVLNLRDKIRTARQVELTKPWKSSFFNAPPNYATGTTYSVGEAVRVAGTGWFIALQGGLSGGSAPTWAVTPQVVSPFQYIQDNTVKWSYFGLDVAVGGGDTTATVSLSSTSSLATANVYTPITGTWNTPTSYQPFGARNLFVPNTASGVTATFASWVSNFIKSPRATSIIPLNSASGLAITSVSHNKNNTGFQVKPNEWEIVTDSLIVEVVGDRFAYASGTSLPAAAPAGLSFMVDDQMVSVGQIYPAAGLLGNNNPIYGILTLSGPRRQRRIRIFGPAYFTGIRLEPNASLYQVDDPAIRSIWNGDSYWAGSAEGPSKVFSQTPQIAMNSLGIRYGATNVSTGATGVEVGAPATAYKWTDLISEVASGMSGVSPPNSITFSSAYNIFDIVFIEFPNGNDSNTGTLQANAVALMQGWRALQPTALIVCVDPWAAPNRIATETAIDATFQAAFAQFADPNSLYIKTRTANGAISDYVQGTGKCASGAVAATGNSSLLCGGDGQHPDDGGIEYTGVCIGNAVALSVNS